MAVKVYTPGQFYAAGGVVEEMFYQEVGRTKKSKEESWFCTFFRTSNQESE